MFKDVGFVLELVKDFGKMIAIGMYFACCFLMWTLPTPYSYVAMAYVLFGMGYFWVPLTREVLQDKYKRYRARKEEAWNILKDSK